MTKHDDGVCSLQIVFEPGTEIRFTPGTPEQKEAYRQQCIKDGTAHLARDSFDKERLKERQVKYITKLVRIKRKLNRSRNKTKQRNKQCNHVDV